MADLRASPPPDSGLAAPQQQVPEQRVSISPTVDRNVSPSLQTGKSSLGQGLKAPSLITKDRIPSYFMQIGNIDTKKSRSYALMQELQVRGG